jgi:predicted nucleic acid-binding protein
MAAFKKGDIVAIIETRVTQFVIGSGRPAETSHLIRIVRVESATRDGATIKSYRTYPASPVYKYENRYNRFKLMTIQSGTTQNAAKRLFDAASYFLDFDTQDAAKAAILAA